MKAADEPLRRSSARASEPRELKQERAMRTREQVLGAAATAFAERGFPAVTMLDVAQLTGMTKGAVYFHYANKEALARAVTEEFYQRLPQVTEDVRRAGLPPLKAVAELLHRTAVAFREDTIIRAGARLQIEASLIDATLPRPFDGYTDSITELLNEAEEAGDLPTSCTPEVLGRVLVAAFFGAQHISWRLCDRADLPERVAEVIQAVLPQVVKESARKAG